LASGNSATVAAFQWTVREDLFSAMSFLSVHFLGWPLQAWKRPFMAGVWL